MNPDDYVVVRGDYATPEWEADARAVFMAGYRSGADDIDEKSAEQAWQLWLAEGRSEPGGMLVYAPDCGDRLVRREKS